MDCWRAAAAPGVGCGSLLSWGREGGRILILQLSEEKVTPLRAVVDGETLFFMHFASKSPTGVLFWSQSWSAPPLSVRPRWGAALKMFALLTYNMKPCRSKRTRKAFRSLFWNTT